MENPVSSGTVNQFGAFEMQATKVGKDSSIQRMIQLVQSADTGKAKTVGIAIVCGALYDLIKERHDPQSKKIYGVMLAIGGILTIAMILKLILS